MTKHYAHEEIQALLDGAGVGHVKIHYINDDIPAGAQAFLVHSPAIVRQLLEENRALLQQLEKSKALDPLAKVPPFDWGPEGVPEGAQIVRSQDGKMLFVLQSGEVAQIDLDAATKNDPGARAYFGLDDG